MQMVAADLQMCMAPQQKDGGMLAHSHAAECSQPRKLWRQSSSEGFAWQCQVQHTAFRSITGDARPWCIVATGVAAGVAAIAPQGECSGRVSHQGGSERQKGCAWSPGMGGELGVPTSV